MKKIILFILTLLAANFLAAEEQMLEATPFAQVEKQIGHGVPIMVEAGSDSCHSCQVMGRLLYRVKKEHPKYRIYFVNVKKERNAVFKLGIQMIPTQIFFDSRGNEVYRHVGVLSPDELEKVLKKYLKSAQKEHGNGN